MENTALMNYFLFTSEQLEDIRASFATYCIKQTAQTPARLYRAVPSDPSVFGCVPDGWETALLKDDEFWQRCDAPNLSDLEPINWCGDFYTPHQLTTQLLHTNIDALRLIMSESLQPGIGDFTKKHVNVFGVTAASLIEAVCDALGVNCAKV